MMFNDHMKYIYIYIYIMLYHIYIYIYMKVSLFDEKKKGLYFIFPNCNVFENGYIFIIAL